jgi:tetratricopeptide (TPR) repeat protein
MLARTFHSIPPRLAAWLLGGCLLLSGSLRAAAEDAPATADAPGQADLDAAIEAKLSADQLDDFGTVLDLCKRALEKGLDDDAKKFATELYTGTLVDRAGMLLEAIVDAPRPDAQWPRMRAFAMRDLAEVVDRDPQIGQAHLMIARLEALPGGDRERAAAAARKALELVGNDRLQQAQAHVVLGTIAEGAEQRLEEFGKAVELAPRDVEIRRTRGLALLVEDEFEKAREDLLVATEEQPDDAGLFEALGMACMMGDRLDEAEKAFDRALEIEPDAAGVLLQRARLLAVRGEKERSLADIGKALDIAPDDASARVLRARVLQQAGDTEKALVDLEEVLRDDPDLAPALELRGLIAAEGGDFETAIRDFRRLVSKNADDPVLLTQLGTLYLAAKQPREAIRRFSRALEIDEESFPGRRGRSDAEITIGDHKAALADLEKALELRPDDTGVLNNLAWLLATSPDDDLRDGKRAIELARQACEKTEWKEAHIVSTLAAGHAESGDFDAARKFSRQAVELGDDTAEVKEQLRQELVSYEAGKPWRERQELPEAGAGAPAIPGGDTAGPPQEPKATKEPRKPRRPFDE